MTDLVGRSQAADSGIARFWKRIPAVVRAVVLGFLVTEIGVISWVTAVTLLPGLWPVIVMGIVLWVCCKYFSGSWWPKATAEARRNRFRALELSPGVWKWGLVAALLFVVVGQSSFVLTFRIIEFPAELFTQQFSYDAIPVWAAWLFMKGARRARCGDRSSPTCSTCPSPWSSVAPARPLATRSWRACAC
jgi:hypothetical protein